MREAEQAWERRRSEQMAKDNQERRQATRRAAIIDQSSISPDTPEPIVTPAVSTVQHQQTGMLAVYEDMNTIAGSRRARTPEKMV